MAFSNRESSGDVWWRIAKIGIWTIVILILLFGTFYTIPAGYKGVLLTFGKPSLNERGEGLNVKVPIIQQVVKMDARTQKYQAKLTAASKDLQDVSTEIAINYHIIGDQAAEIYRGIGEDYSDKVIYPMEQEANKATTAQFTAEEMITKREQVRQKMKEILAPRLQERGIVLEDISIVDFDFSESFNNAIEAKVTAEQNALKEQNNLKVVQFQAQQKVEQAKGEAEAIRIINEQLLTSPQYVSYITIQKWDGKMPLALGSGSLLSISGGKQ